MGLMVGLTRVLPLCAVLLVIPAIAASQLIPPPPPPPALQPPPHLTLSLNPNNFQPGDTHILTATVTPGGSASPVDVYLALQLPDQTLLFYQSNGSLTQEAQPLVANWTVTPFSGEVFRYTFSGTEPDGTYTWYAAFTDPGTLNIIGDMAQAPFTFNPFQPFADGEKLAVSPIWGPLGRTVTAIGSGWYDHARLGWDVPIWIGFANEVARGHPDANGEFSVSLTIPLNPPPQEIINGKPRISAIIGNGGSADAFYTVSNTPPPGCVDAYFIGVHGVQQDAGAPEIEETRQAFAANTPPGKTTLYTLLPYHAPDFKDWTDLANLFVPAEQAGVQELTNVIKDSPNGILYGILEKCPTQSIVLVGYSLGAWVVNDWLSKNSDVWPNIRAVELYGDPLWHRSGHDASSGQDYDYAGLAAGLVTPDPYSNTPTGPGVGISNRWQSWCLQNDPVCGEGYSIVDLVHQASDAKACLDTNCEHLKYTKDDYGHGRGYDLTTRGGEFLASQTFP
jgi:Cutinase